MVFYGLLHKDAPMLANQQKCISALCGLKDLLGAIKVRDEQLERVKWLQAFSNDLILYVRYNIK